MQAVACATSDLPADANARRHNTSLKIVLIVGFMEAFEYSNPNPSRPYMSRDRALMELHVEALYTHDPAGDLVTVREQGGGPAPRFLLGRTAVSVLRRFRTDVDEALRRELVAASSDELRLDPSADPAVAAAGELARYAAILAQSAPIRTTEAGPAFSFPAHLRPTAGTSGTVVLVTEANSHLLHPLLSAWVPDVRQSPPLMALVENGRAVAVCASVRITPRAHEAGVDTAAEFRGRGYAPIVVAEWARAVRALGAEPLYSTSWQNAASRAVARKLSLVQFGSDLHIT